ncbi:hypothetical protein [Clostridium sp. Marseille-P2415]|uniref:hypothetical protein n=1 Tax=Clostridium sp. Marseille-P2415 TaxID=1805471 RepID=UPI00098836F1|nr:hypothetical protein [Clostridium sp. Marseille-P2415]
MEQIYNEYDTENVLIKGWIRYQDFSPVRGAVVILEKIDCFYNEELQEEDYQGIYLNHTLTNRNGEFCFIITDKKSSYKIKVFDNHHR